MADEEEDLAALRSAVLASMLQPKAAAVIPKAEERAMSPPKSDDDDDDLAALRAAALLSKRKKSQESLNDSRRSSSFSDRHSVSNGQANLILIPTQNSDVVSVKPQSNRNQKRWGGSLNSSTASTPTKTSVGRKFSRLDQSDSESESEDEPITDTKKSDDELGSDVDIHLGFDLKEAPAVSTRPEVPPPDLMPEAPQPVRIKTEPIEMGENQIVYQDIDDRLYNQAHLNEFGDSYTKPVVVEEHGDVDMRRVESHLKPPKLQIQVNMDGAGDRRRVQVAEPSSVQELFRVTVSNLNQQRNILLDGGDGRLYQEGIGVHLAGRLGPVDDLSVHDSGLEVVPHFEEEQPKQLSDSEQFANSGYWDTPEQFRKRKQSYDGRDVPWNDTDDYNPKKVIETDQYLSEKVSRKMYINRESYMDHEKPKLSLRVDRYSDTDSKTDSLLTKDTVSTREHDIAVNAEYWVTADQVSERVIKRGGKIKHKGGEKKPKSRSPRAEKLKYAKDSKHKSRIGKKHRQQPESSLDRYSGDESEVTTSRDVKHEQDDSFSESELISSRDRSPSESDLKNNDTIDDESKFSEDTSSISQQPSRPVPKKKKREPDPPVRAHKNSAKSPKHFVVSPKKDGSPRGRREVLREQNSLKSKHAINDTDEIVRQTTHSRVEEHVKEKHSRHKADVEKVQRVKVERVRKPKIDYEEEFEEEHLPVKTRKSRPRQQVSDVESSPERYVKNKRHIKKDAAVSVKHSLPGKKKSADVQIERISRPKQRSPRKQKTPEPEEPKRSPGERMYRARKLPEEEGELTDEETEERVCKSVKVRKDHVKMREAIGECSRKIEKLRKEDKEEGELDESPVDQNRKPLRYAQEEKEEGEISEGPSERKRKLQKSRKVATPDSDEDLEERLASRKLQKLRKDKAKTNVEVSDEEEEVVSKKKAKVVPSEEQVIEKKAEKKIKSKAVETGAKHMVEKAVVRSRSEKSESIDKADVEDEVKTNQSKKSTEVKVSELEKPDNVAKKITGITSPEEIPLPQQLKKPANEEKKTGDKITKETKKVETGKAAKVKKTDEESGQKWKKVGEGEEERAMSPFQEVLEEANKEAEDATKLETKSMTPTEENDKTAAGKFKKFQLEKPGTKKAKKSEDEAKTKPAQAKKPAEPKKLDKAGLKLSETKEKLMKILAQGKLKTLEAKKDVGKKDDSINFSAGLQAIVQRKGASDTRKKVAAAKTVLKKAATKRKKVQSKSPKKRSNQKSSRSRHRDSRSRSRSRSRSSSRSSYTDRRKSRHRRRRRYTSSESSRSRYSRSSYSRRSRSRSRRRSYSRRRSRSRSRSYSRRKSRSRSRRRSRSRKRSSSRSRSSSRTRSSSRSGSTSSTRSSSHSRSTRSSSSGSTSSTSSASSKNSDDNAAWRFKHTGKSAKATESKADIFERKRTDIEIEQKKRQDKGNIDKELPDDRRGNFQRNDDRPWRGGHDYRYNNHNNRGRFMYDNRPRNNDFGFRGAGRYHRDWYPRGGYRNFRDYRQDDNFRDFRNQNRERPPFINRRNRSWSSGSDNGGSQERSRSKDKKSEKPIRSKSRDDSKDTENKRSDSRDSGAQNTKTAGANKLKSAPKSDKEKDDAKGNEKDNSDVEGSQQGDNKRDKERLPVHKRLGSQLGSVIPAKMTRRVQDNEPDPKADKELEERIERIRQQNAKILKRQQEVDRDKKHHQKTRRVTVLL